MNLNDSHLPSWIEKNPVFRKLFLLRKLYLTRTRFSHHSQSAEDVSIVRLFPRDFRGFFVDVGCFHPKKYNNTWRLYRQGWRGINIDLDSIKIEGFDMVRPDDINIVRAVSNTEGEIRCFSSGFYSLTTSVESGLVEGQSGYVPKTVRASRLTGIIDETPYRDRVIDFLAVDAEGHDLEVLHSLDFERYQPRVVAVETECVVLSEVARSPLYLFLQRKGYGLVGWCGFTLILASPEHQRRLTSSPP